MGRYLQFQFVRINPRAAGAGEAYNDIAHRHSVRCVALLFGCQHAWSERIEL